MKTFTKRVKERYVDNNNHYHNIIRDGILVISVTSGITFLFKGMIFHSIAALTSALLKDQIASVVVGGYSLSAETITTLLQKKVEVKEDSIAQFDLAKENR